MILVVQNISRHGEGCPVTRPLVGTRAPQSARALITKELPLETCGGLRVGSRNGMRETGANLDTHVGFNSSSVSQRQGRSRSKRCAFVVTR